MHDDHITQWQVVLGLCGQIVANLCTASGIHYQSQAFGDGLNMVVVLTILLLRRFLSKINDGVAYAFHRVGLHHAARERPADFLSWVHVSVVLSLN